MTVPVLMSLGPCAKSPETSLSGREGNTPSFSDDGSTGVHLERRFADVSSDLFKKESSKKTVY